ncbi:hypothetical protein ABIB62_000421 [Mucilaginibacter sp. UYP25]|uniref:hypothetical protein n=1 Tax=unclassified Mucilaginibacter TaxID=2617802 RepID=UPI0033972D35
MIKKFPKKLFAILLSFSPITVLCQTIGQNAETVKQQIDYQVKSYYRAQGYHQVREDYRTDYKNGQISDVIFCQENVPMIDLGETADFCTHYIMDKGKLSYIQIQYATISIDKLAIAMSKNNIHIGKYYFGDDDKAYSIIYLSANQQATKEIRSSAINPIPVNIQRQLTALRQQKEEIRELANDNSPFDPTKAIDYTGFAQQEDKVLYSELNDIYLNQKVNNKLMATVSVSLKAVIAYYSSISNSSALTKNLNLGAMCSPELTSYISKYFNNSKEIMSQVSQCKIRGIGNEYSLNRLEVSQFNGRITASFAMTYYKDGRSQDDVIGVDEFKINPDQSISVINLSPKESAQKKSTSINTQVYDVEKTAPDTYEAFKLKLRAELIRVIKAGNKYIPSFQNFYDNIDKSNFNPSWSITRNYNIDWSTYYDDADYRKTEKHQTITNDKDVNYWSLLWACKIDMPSITVNGVNVKYVTLTVSNVDVNFTKGISVARIKDDEIEFNSKYVPPAKAIEKIKLKILGLHYRGDYLITYELGKVLNEDYENINFEKIKNNTYKTPAGWVIKL